MGEKQNEETGQPTDLGQLARLVRSPEAEALTAPLTAENRASEAVCRRCGELDSLHAFRPYFGGDLVRDGVRGVLDCPPKAVSLPPIEVEPIPPAQGVKYLDGKTFREDGYLQEANREFFHPLGLALELDLESGTLRVWDYREDPEGIAFVDGDLLPNAERIETIRATRRKPRIAKLGYWIQGARPQCDAGLHARSLLRREQQKSRDSSEGQNPAPAIAGADPAGHSSPPGPGEVDTRKGLPSPESPAPLAWTAKDPIIVEEIRREMMRRFSDELSMEEIADFAYAVDAAIANQPFRFPAPLSNSYDVQDAAAGER